MGASAIPGVVGREILTGDIAAYANKDCKHCRGAGYLVILSQGGVPRPCRARKCALDAFQIAHSDEVEVYEGKLRWKAGSLNVPD